MVNNSQSDQKTVSDIQGKKTTISVPVTLSVPPSPAVSGETSVSGSNPNTESDDDTTQMVSQVIGNDPQPGKPFSIADEVDRDEADRHGTTS